MTRVKSLRFGRRQDESGYAHRIHRSKKRRVKAPLTKFHLKQRKRIKAQKLAKERREIIRREKMWIA